MLDTVGCTNGARIETCNGRLVDVTNLCDRDITISVIAHSLARLCRFNGHCRTFVSVAEHSCRVLDCVKRRMTFRKGRYEPILRAALLHDASEAYLTDLPRPLKLLFPEYVTLEHKVQKRIFARFNIDVTEDEYAIIKEADNAVLKAEARLEMPSRAERWGMDSVTAENIGYERWSIERSENEFLLRASCLM